MNSTEVLDDGTKLYSFNHNLPNMIDSNDTGDQALIRFGHYQSYENHGSFPPVWGRLWDLEWVFGRVCFFHTSGLIFL